jgi:hypothetical protein
MCVGCGNFGDLLVLIEVTTRLLVLALVMTQVHGLL